MQHLTPWRLVVFVLSLKYHITLARYHLTRFFTANWSGTKVSKLLEIKEIGAVMAAHSPIVPDFKLLIYIVSFFRKSMTLEDDTEMSLGLFPQGGLETVSNAKIWQNLIQCAAMTHPTKNILWYMQLEIMVTHWNRLYCWTHIYHTCSTNSSKNLAPCASISLYCMVFLHKCI